MKLIALFTAGLAASLSVNAQSLLKVSSNAWAGLSLSEQATLQRQYLIEPMPSVSFGTIIDNQGQDRSTPGSNVGSNLGQAIGSATYIDSAFRSSGNYSAKNHLAATIIGGLLGSALDQRPQSLFQFRYAIRLADGNVAYFDATSTEPFRHPTGVCVSLPTVSLLPDQSLCIQSAEYLRTRYLGGNQIHPSTTSQPAPSTENHQKMEPISNAVPTTSVGLILCKAGSIAPVSTTIEKCALINGEVLK